MKKYLTIGEVARLKGVNIKSLRYYDRLNILRPAYVNPENGYRYYVPEQLMTLDLIILFIDLGIPLKNFHDYEDREGRIDLGALLAAGERMARERIAALTDNLVKMERIGTALANYRAHRAGEFYVRRFPERSALAVDWDVNIPFEQSVKALTDLYFLSLKLGLTALYQSGLVLDGRSGKPGCALYLEVLGRCEHPTFLTLPAGNYGCTVQESDERALARGLESANASRLVVIEDILTQCTEGLGTPAEMQELLPE